VEGAESCKIMRILFTCSVTFGARCAQYDLLNNTEVKAKKR